jgi:type IV fimbrial biogenesis protein FimT
MKSTQDGFTLLELMTAVAIVAILVAIATPSFRSFSANSRISATANSVVNALAVARSEALRRSIPVAVCASTNSQTCSGNQQTDWKNGWIVFTDGSGTPGQLDSTDAVVQVWSAPSGGVTVSLNDPNNDNYIRFDARGMKIPTTAVSFTVTSSGCAGTNASQIALTVAGSPQSTKVACP